MITRIPALLLILAAAMLLAAGCGDGDSGSDDGASNEDTTEEPASEDTGSESDDEATEPAGDSATVKLGVEGNKLVFDQTELELAGGSGPITLELDNTSTIPHNIAIEDADGTELAAGDIVGKDETSTITVDLEPGTYTYFCQPHKSSGMTGTLTVT